GRNNRLARIAQSGAALLLLRQRPGVRIPSGALPRTCRAYARCATGPRLRADPKSMRSRHNKTSAGVPELDVTASPRRRTSMLLFRRRIAISQSTRHGGCGWGEIMRSSLGIWADKVVDSEDKLKSELELHFNIWQDLE